MVNYTPLQVKQKLKIRFQTAVQRFQQNWHKVNVGKKLYHVIKKRLNVRVWSVQARIKQTAKVLECSLVDDKPSWEQHIDSKHPNKET